MGIINRFEQIAFKYISKKNFNRYFENYQNEVDSELFDDYLECSIGNRKIKVPTINEYGKNYPCYATHVVHNLFDIKEGDLVVDVGGGGNPLKRADIVVDLFPGVTSHRGGLIKTFDHQKFIKGDVQNMDFFSDKEVDFLFTQQTLEHVNDPEKALSEIIRVAKRGFIDVPCSSTEVHMGHPEHRWLIDLVGNSKIIFRKKTYIHSQSPVFGIYPKVAFAMDDEISMRLEYYYRNVSNVQLLWNDDFQFEVYD